MTTYRALIVDDEPLARLALRQYLSMTPVNIEIVGEASNGLEALAALQKLQQVDILFADIQMPRMNGVELLRSIKELVLLRQPLVIMLSAFGDYHYVRDSFVIGAFDYMLKANLDEDYLKAVLDKTIAELKSRQSRADAPYDKDEQTLAMQILQQLSVMDEAELPCFEQNEESGKGFSALKALFGERNQEVALVRLSQSIPFDHTHRMIFDTISSVTSAYHSEGVCRIIRHDDRQYALYFTFANHCSTMAIRKHTHMLLSEVSMRLRQFMNLKLSIGISDVADGWQKWNALFRQAKRLSELSYYHGYDHLLYPEAERFHSPAANWASEWAEYKLELLGVMKNCDGGLWRHRLEQGLELLHARYPSSPELIKSTLIDMIWEAGALLFRQSSDGRVLQQWLLPPAEQMRDLETWSETKLAVHSFFEMLHERLHPKRLSSTASWLSPAVAKAKAFIERHYDEEIHLSHISEMVGVSDSHLSKQFTKEIGVNFIAYLTELRIQKAKEGLENGLKIYDVSERVGYVNPEHFSRIFKKVTGISPLAYRREYERKFM